MNTLRTRHLTSLFSLLGLALLGPGCTGFISGNDDTASGSTAETSGDGDGDGDGDGAPGGDTTIYALQQGMVPENSVVTVKGVVVTSPINTEDGLAFVEEPGAGEYSGISLYLWDEVVMTTQLAPGEVVDITGEYAEFFGVSQLVVKNVGDIVVVGSDAVPGPDVVSVQTLARPMSNTDAEPWEGVRVCIEDAAVDSPNDGFGQYLLVGDALVGNAFVDPLPDVQVGGSFSQVCGSLHYSFDEWKLQPTSAADLAGYTPPMATAVSIYDIQQDMVPVGSVVTLENVVASSGLTWSDAVDAAFFVQEIDGGPYSGIQIFVADTTGLDIVPGDTITLTGIYDEFFDMSQIEVADASAINIGGSGAAPTPEIIANPADIATNGSMTEQWESVLVQVENVVVIDENPDAPMEFGEFVVTGDLRIDDLFFAFADWTKPALDQSYASITGLLTYNYSNFKLEPREQADLVQN